jgi:hypothetical protein
MKYIITKRLPVPGSMVDTEVYFMGDEGFTYEKDKAKAFKWFEIIRLLLELFIKYGPIWFKKK